MPAAILLQNGQPLLLQTGANLLLQQGGAAPALTAYPNPFAATATPRVDPFAATSQLKGSS